MITVRKSFLKNYLFSDNLNFWVLQAISFKEAADSLLQVNLNKTHSKYISTLEINAEANRIKIACFLYSTAIELFLKSIYVKNKNSDDQEKTESFGHKVKKLYDKLVSKNIFKKNQISDELLTSVSVILHWYGRYFKPNGKETDTIIDDCFEPTTDNPDMLKPKFSANFETACELKNLCDFLLNFSGQVNNASIDCLFSIPF